MSNTKSKKEKKEFFEYKSRPLVRSGNVIYYGNISDKYVAKLEITETKKVKDLEVASRVNVALISTENEVKIAKTSEKPGLYPALDIANIWLERAAVEN